jgi:hypothetical protein
MNSSSVLRPKDLTLIEEGENLMNPKFILGSHFEESVNLILIFIP